MRKSKFHGAFVLNRRVDLHAIDATPARWRGGVSSSPLDGTSTAASSPRKNPSWLISTQVRLARAAAAANTPTTLTVFRDMPHVSPIFSFCHETPRTALQRAEDIGAKKIRDFLKSKGAAAVSL